MSAINQVRNENVNISETAIATKNAGIYGVAGSPTLSDYDKRVNKLLMAAVKSKWDSVVSNPPSGKVLFLPTWYVGVKDVEMFFRMNSVVKPILNRSNDWRLQLVNAFVDVHIFVRGAGRDDEPPLLGQVENGLDKVIEVYTNELIPNAHCALISFATGGTEEADDVQALWHSIASVEVAYWKEKKLPP